MKNSIFRTFYTNWPIISYINSTITDTMWFYWAFLCVSLKLNLPRSQKTHFWNKIRFSQPKTRSESEKTRSESQKTRFESTKNSIFRHFGWVLLAGTPHKKKVCNSTSTKLATCFESTYTSTKFNRNFSPVFSFVSEICNPRQYT